MSWVAVGTVAVGAVVSAGGAAYSANQSKKAAKKAAGTSYNTTPELLGDPAQVDPYTVLQQMYSANSLNYRNAKDQQAGVNSANYQQAVKYYNQILPGFSGIQSQIGSNVSSFARGELPQDVQSQITRNAAQQGIQGGYGFGSQGGRGGAQGNLTLRNLGLTSLDLAKYGTNLGMQASQNAKSLLPNLASLQDFLLSSGQALGVAQQNATAQNQFALQNNSLMNGAIGSANQQAYNQAQATYAGQLQQAQAAGQAAQQVGGLISSYGTGINSPQSSGTKAAPTQVVGTASKLA